MLIYQLVTILLKDIAILIKLGSTLVAIGGENVDFDRSFECVTRFEGFFVELSSFAIADADGRV